MLEHLLDVYYGDYHCVGFIPSKAPKTQGLCLVGIYHAAYS